MGVYLCYTVLCQKARLHFLTLQVDTIKIPPLPTNVSWVYLPSLQLLVLLALGRFSSNLLYADIGLWVYVKR